MLLAPEAQPPTRQIAVSPADGGPVFPVWSAMPAFSDVTAVWPDGQGGLIVVGVQAFRGEDRQRTTIWSLDTNRTARHIACAPPGDYLDDVMPAIGPDGYYFLARLDGSKMQIVRVPRAGL